MKTLLITLLLIASISAERHIHALPSCFLKNCKSEVKACRADSECWKPMIICLSNSYDGGAREDDLVNQAKECVKNQNAIDFMDCTYKNCSDDYNKDHKHHNFY